jgi:hypothetical protein
MNNDPNDFSRQAQDFFSRSFSEQVRVTQRAYDLAWRFARGELSAQTFYDEYLRFAGQEAGRYASDLAMLGLNFYKDWFALSLRYSNRFYERVGAKPEARPENIATKPSTAKSEMNRDDSTSIKTPGTKSSKRKAK